MENKIKDSEAKLFMLLLNLKEEKNKQYSPEECAKNIVYLFSNYDEIKLYFETNDFSNITEEVIDLCIMKTTKKGTVIALKGLCDHAIRTHKSVDINKEKEQFTESTVPHHRKFIVEKGKEKDFKNAKLTLKLENKQKKQFKK